MTIPWDRPRTPHALHSWIAEVLGLRIGRRPLLPAHHGPFEYLVHTHFEGVCPKDDAPDQAIAHDAAASWRNGQAAPPDVVLWANRGGGKTMLGALATTLDLLFKPGIQVRILAGSLEQAARMLAHLRRFFSVPDLAGTLGARATQRRLVLANGSEVEILAASQASIRGTRVQKLRCDEVDLFDPDLWEAAQLTTRSESLGGVHVRGAVECLSTMHRPHGLMFNLVKECASGARRLFKWGVLDTIGVCPPERDCAPCPLLPECQGRAKRLPRAADGERAGHISIDDAIVLKSRVSRAAWESEMLCLRPSRSHAVYPEFDAAVHVVDDAPREQVQWVAGMDFGFRASTVILWAALDPGGTLWIVDEHVLAEGVMDVHVGALRRSQEERGVPRPTWIGVDPAGHQRNDQTGVSNVDLLRRAGLTVRSRPSALGEGLALVRARLRPATGAPRLCVHRRCAGLIEALERYHYPDDDPESMVPVKDGPDHAADALRYLVLNLDRPHTSSTSRYTPGR